MFTTKFIIYQYVVPDGTFEDNPDDQIKYNIELHWNPDQELTDYPGNFGIRILSCFPRDHNITSVTIDSAVVNFYLDCYKAIFV